MPELSKQIAVLGSTGSIGASALEVIAASNGRLHAAALSAQSKFDRLVSQARLHRPRWVIATDERAAQRFDWSGLPEGCELVTGTRALVDVASHEEIDLVLA